MNGMIFQRCSQIEAQQHDTAGKFSSNSLTVLDMSGWKQSNMCIYSQHTITNADTNIKTSAIIKKQINHNSKHGKGRHAWKENAHDAIYQ